MIRRLLLLGALVSGLLAGCLGKPPVEERWTHLEMIGVTVPDSAALRPGERVTVRLDGRVTFRRLVTGFLVGEVRTTAELTADSLALDDEDLVLASESVDHLLRRSTPVARAVKPLAGFPQLRRTVPMEFTVDVPATPGSVDGAAPSFFLVLYMGDGEEIELADGRDSLVVDPFETHEDEVLAQGRPLAFAPGGSP